MTVGMASGVECAVGRMALFAGRHIDSSADYREAEDALPAAEAFASLPFVPRERSLERLRQRTFTEIIDPALRATTRDEFVKFAGDHLREFLRLHIAIAELVAALIAEGESLPAESHVLTGVTATVERLTGSIGADELEFCVSTMKRAREVVDRFSALPEPSDQDADNASASGFNTASVLQLFGLVCLVRLGQKGAPAPADDVVMAVMETLRAGALHAYVCARTGFDLRAAAVAEAPVPDDFAFDAATPDFMDGD